MRITRAVTHIHLFDANHAKIAALDALATEYLRLCQAYATFFCTDAQPAKYAAPCFASRLSQRWQRVAIQHAAGIAQSWRTNYAAAYQDYLDLVAEYEEKAEVNPPEWKEWSTPVLKVPVIQANANVALLVPTADSTFDYWLRLSTLDQQHPIFLPVKLADYHRHALAGKTLNTSTVLTRKADGWWLTLSYDEAILVTTPKKAPVVGVDVGIANFITTSEGKHCGTFNGKLAARHRRDQELAACADRKVIKALLARRHQEWQDKQRLAVVQPPAQLFRQRA